MPFSSDHDSTSMRGSPVVITDLARYAIKGLSGDPLDTVFIPGGGVMTFPDDRRFALLRKANRDKFDAVDPVWLHKENFLCAFSAPELMAGFQSRYEIVDGANGEGTQRLLTLHRRDDVGVVPLNAEPALGPLDLGTHSGRDALADFFAAEAGEPLVCATKEADGELHTFQFGNTRAGVKHNPGGDTRTVHIVNRATVQELEKRSGVKLDAWRFRPNIVIDGATPWEEFAWVGRTLRVVAARDNYANDEASSLIIKVLTRTVRCAGIGIDPRDPGAAALDVPRLLSEHYPEHGPYLGVYASIEVVGGGDGEGKLLSVGDTLELL